MKSSQFYNNSEGNIVINDNSLKTYMVLQDGLNVLYLPDGIEHLHFNCLVPPRIDAIQPENPHNGQEVHADGQFYIYGTLANEAHLMLWNNKWWDRTTR